MTDPPRVLVERVAALDAQPIAADVHGPIDTDVAHFIRVLEAIVPSELARLPPPVDAQAADELVAGCRRLRRLGMKAPSITTEPLDRAEQHWIWTANPPWRPARPEPLARKHFVEAAGAGAIPPATKPFDLGLYTSTAVFGTAGMWWCSLLLNDGSSLRPRPWKVWSVRAEPHARVAELATAADWVDFVLADPLEADGLLYPDWRRVADRWDAVHMLLGAVAATQGLCLRTDDGVVAPTYWDVESTLWLSWVFDEVEPAGPAQS